MNVVSGNKKNNKARRYVFILLILFFLNVPLLNPTASLRYTAALQTFSSKPITSPIRKDSSRMTSLNSRQTGYVFEDPPPDRAIGGYLETWVVTRYGFIYITKYYGYW